jgi:hypothetical protein
LKWRFQLELAAVAFDIGHDTGFDWVGALQATANCDRAASQLVARASGLDHLPNHSASA